MNRLGLPSTRSRPRPRRSVMLGTALGLVAGSAVYGAVSSASVTATTPLIKPALVSAATPVAALAPCAKGQKLEHGVCVVHVRRTVVVRAPAAVSGPGPVSNPEAGSSSSGEQAAEGPDQEAAEPGEDAAEHAADAAEHAAEHAAEDPAEHPEAPGN